MEMRDVLVVAASVAFALIVLWRFRPQLSAPEHDRPVPKKLARQLEAATTAPEKAALLFGAGNQALSALRYGSAENYFRRALRVQPGSVDLLGQVVTAMARRPRGLEALLWRRLADARYEGTDREASIASLVALIQLYDRTPKQRHKAASLRQMLGQLEPASMPAEPASTATL